MTAYLVNQSRALRSELARDPLARNWIPEGERMAVRQLWEEYAGAVYPHDDLVVSLRGRFVLDALTKSLEQDGDTVLVVCGAGFSSYPWLLNFPVALEVDLPDIVAAKRKRVAHLAAVGVVGDREVHHLAVDLGNPGERRWLVDRAREVADGRAVVYVAEGVIYYLSPDAARATVLLGGEIASGALTEVITYWPASARDNPVLQAQRSWFRHREVPEDSTYLTGQEMASLMVGEVEDISPEDLQRRYLGEIAVPEIDLIPEYVAVARA